MSELIFNEAPWPDVVGNMQRSYPRTSSMRQFLDRGKRHGQELAETAEKLQKRLIHNDG
jgi:hypothetical protein